MLITLLKAWSILPYFLILLVSSACDSATSAVFYKGFYNNKIKVSEVSKDDDIPKTVEALQALGANIYGYLADDGDASAECVLTVNENGSIEKDYDEAGFYWCHFQELLEATEGKDIAIIAVIREKHQVTSNRWTEDDFYTDPSYTMTDQETFDHWLKAHVAAAKDLSALSEKYPQFIGFTIDDFGARVCHNTSTSGCYTISQVASIAAAAHSTNSGFKFLPTLYYDHDIFKNILGSLVLGSPYGQQKTKGDYAMTTLSFQLSAIPEKAMLSFLYLDNNTKEETEWETQEADTVVTVNDITVLRKAFWEDDGVEYFNQNIAPYLKVGNNYITIGVDYVTNINAYKDVLLYVGPVTVGLDASTINCDSLSDSCSIVFSSLNQTMSYDEPVAENNSSYDLTDSVDGVLAPFRAESSYYNADSYSTILKTTKEALAEKLLLSVNYASLWGSEINADVLKAQIQETQKIADGILVWNPPLALVKPGEGILAERESSKSDYALMFYWPSYMSGLEGWYVQYKSKSELSGNITVKVIDSESSSSYSGQYFQKTISDKLGNVYYQDYLGNNNATEETVTFSMSTSSKLLIKMGETNNVGNNGSSVYYNVTSSNGVLLTQDDFNFESGSEDSDINDIYEMLKKTYPTL